ncbi:MAG: hypothetical protein P4M14_07495 [Gammaproteobacteria bacterium]|nr:hypothetical protein [Gammaproteobacteria bacterium]
MCLLILELLFLVFLILKLIFSKEKDIIFLFEMTEMIAHIALNNFTNYFNNIAKVEVDFPKAELLGEKIS